MIRNKKLRGKKTKKKKKSKVAMICSFCFYFQVARCIVSYDNYVHISRYFNSRPTKRRFKRHEYVNGISYGITIVHCKEIQMEWIPELPNHWDITIYETCGEHISDYSMPYQNAGSEECTSYLETIIDQYDNLPNISIFVQSDILLDHGKKNRELIVQHSPFCHISELINFTVEWAESNQGSYVAYGPTLREPKNISKKLPYVEEYPKELYDDLKLSLNEKGTLIQGTSGACFAVHRDRIHKHSVDIYKELQRKILQEKKRARRRCCAFENMWHIVFGENDILSNNAILNQQWSNILNVLGDWHATNITDILEASKK